jgi:hypothetical protein
MNTIDAYVLGLLAVIDLAVIVLLRRRHNRSAQAGRLMRGLQFAVRREIEQADSLPRGRQLLRAI